MSEETVTKSKIEERMFEKAKDEFKKGDISKIVSLYEETVLEAVRDGDKVQLVGFMTIEPKVRSARKGYNPLKNEELEIAAKMGLKISPGSKLKKAVEELDIEDFA